MKKILIFVILAFSCGIAFAYENHWQVVDISQFEDYMSLRCIVQIDGEEQFVNSLELAAFCGDECRGAKFAAYFPPTQRYIFQMAVYGNPGETMTFRIYDHIQDCELMLDGPEPVSYTPDILGSLSNPYVVNFTTPAFTFLGSETNHNWSTASNWNTGTLPSATDDVVIDGVCELDQDATVASLTVNEGKNITVSNGVTLTIAETLTTTDASQLVVEEGGQLVHVNENVMATLRKNIIGYTDEKDHYYLVANPTANASVVNMDVNEYDLYTFDPTRELEWAFQSEPAMTRNVGYLYANSNDVTLGFAGVITPAGEKTIDLTYYEGNGSGRDYPGFNLVGNPFACNAYIEGCFYRMNNTELIAASDEPIAPCEGIFVEATGTGQSLTFATTAFSEDASIKLSLGQGRGAVLDRAMLSFGNSGNLHKFMMDENSTQLYFPQDGEKFAALAVENVMGEMPVNFKAAQNGVYRITVNAMNMSYLHIIDNMTGTDTDLLAAPAESYIFNAKTTDYASRFKLVFDMTDVGENMADASFACICNGNLIVNGAEQGSRLQVIDALGRVVRSEQLGENVSIDVRDLRAGVYVIRLANGEKAMTQKLVIK